MVTTRLPILLGALASASALQTAPSAQSPADSRSAASERNQVWGDFDGDGFRDLYVLDPRAGDSLLRNLGNGEFDNVTQATGIASQRPTRKAEWIDLNKDGTNDIITGTELGAFVFFGKPRTASKPK